MPKPAFGDAARLPTSLEAFEDLEIGEAAYTRSYSDTSEQGSALLIKGTSSLLQNSITSRIITPHMCGECDGTDDRLAINRALTAVRNRGYGSVKLESNLVLDNSLFLDDGDHIDLNGYSLTWADASTTRPMINIPYQIGDIRLVNGVIDCADIAQSGIRTFGENIGLYFDDIEVRRYKIGFLIENFGDVKSGKFFFRDIKIFEPAPVDVGFPFRISPSQGNGIAGEMFEDVTINGITVESPPGQHSDTNGHTADQVSIVGVKDFAISKVRSIGGGELPFVLGRSSSNGTVEGVIIRDTDGGSMQIGTPQQYIRLADQSNIAVGDTLTFTNPERTFTAVVQAIGAAIVNINGSGVPALDDVITNNDNGAVNTFITEEEHARDIAISNIVSSNNALDVGGTLTTPYEVYVAWAKGISLTGGIIKGNDGVLDILAVGSDVEISGLDYTTANATAGSKITRAGRDVEGLATANADMSITSRNHDIAHSLQGNVGSVVTIENDPLIPPGTSVKLYQRGAGVWAIQGGAGVNLYGMGALLSDGDPLTRTSRYTITTLFKRADDEWHVENSQL